MTSDGTGIDGSVGGAVAIAWCAVIGVTIYACICVGSRHAASTATTSTTTTTTTAATAGATANVHGAAVVSTVSSGHAAAGASLGTLGAAFGTIGAGFLIGYLAVGTVALCYAAYQAYHSHYLWDKTLKRICDPREYIDPKLRTKNIRIILNHLDSLIVAIPTVVLVTILLPFLVIGSGLGLAARNVVDRFFKPCTTPLDKQLPTNALTYETSLATIQL